MARQVVVRLKGRKMKYDKNGKRLDSRSDMDDGAEYSVSLAHDSRYWEPRIDESDAFGPVTIYDAEGRITRVIEREALKRPWQERPGNTWNNSLFPRRVSDKV